MIHYQYIVVGTGLIGSAAVRHLSQVSNSVCGVGVDEPADQQNHFGPFSSHYDQGRLTRILGRNTLLSKFAFEAIQRYPEIEKQSGIRFHGAVGTLMALDPNEGSRYAQKDLAPIMQVFDVDAQFYEPQDKGWQAKFPFLNFPDSLRIIHESPPAGYVNPRQMRAAQLECARKNGATLIKSEVISTRVDTNQVLVILKDGSQLSADKVLVATGAFTNKPGLLPVHIPFKVKTEVVLLGEVSESEAKKLESMPTVIFQIKDPEIHDIYMTPPILYPDGKWCIKMGFNSISDTYPETQNDIQEWFRSGNSDIHKEAMVRAIKFQLPDVEFKSFETKRCAIANTPSGYPIIDRVNKEGTLKEGTLFVAAGGNGAGAKGSDSWGRFAAQLMLDSSQIDPAEQAIFKLENNQNEQ
ncbi:MAG: glycine/D-amino acid oxidase-like deaminating enzyme [Cellvibrionaceae bacterium]|jgi:glycine/D-amino acid oxidase-like deaminating enzyme